MNKDLLIKILNTISVSGNEHDITFIFSEYATARGMSVQIDSIGNICAFHGCSDLSHVKLMIEAHCDEIGFQVIHVSESGYVYLRRNGGVDEQCIPGSQMLIQTRDNGLIPGVVGKKPIHLMNADDRKRTIEIHQLWLDTGMEADEVKRKVSVGDYVATSPNVRFLNKDRITSKALDNKLGVFALTQIMERIADAKLDYGICLATTTQEEVGSRGALVCANNVKPEIAITIDLDFATDVPDCNPTRYGKVYLGEGVIIPRNVDCDPQLSHRLETIAKKHDIAYQISARPHATGGTNTSRIQLASNGVRTISLGIPCRYMHTPVELCDLRDVSACVALTIEYIKELATSTCHI